MYSKPLTPKQLLVRVLIYSLMAVSVVILVVIITLFMLGFRLNHGNLEQYALLQFSSTPSGATVAVDGQVIGSKTPNKQSLPAGQHKVEMWREGYQTWTKTVDIKIGTITWLNYALLVPKNLKVESVAKYDSVYSSVASPRGNYILLNNFVDKPIFELHEITADKVKTDTLTLPEGTYSEADDKNVKHVFNLGKWDEDGRYVLVEHKYDDKIEWLVLDTQEVKSSKNITKTFNISLANIVFADTSGNKFYAQDSSDVRKLDLASGTISRPLVQNVTSFDYYSKNKVITFIGRETVDSKDRVVGVLREGDEKTAVVKKITSGSSTPLLVATTRYFNENYVAIIEGNKVEILSGSYPNTTSDNSNSLKTYAKFDLPNNVLELNFSPSGEYVFVRTDKGFTSYDLEYQKLTTNSFNGGLRWLNDNYLWSDLDNKLSIREFDGANLHNINSVVSGQAVTMTNNGRYLYSIGRSGGQYQLQRVRMILP